MKLRTSTRIAIAFALLAFLGQVAFCETQPRILDEVSLGPSLASEEDAYAQIKKAFGEKSIESPDLFAGNHAGFEHIQIRKDPEVGACFDFYLHRDEDGDRAKEWPEGEKRQRNEIKGYAGSQDGLKATKRQVVRYTWLFRIAEDMSVTKNFSHFFQLKAVGGANTSSPLFTVSGSRTGKGSQLEVRTQPTNQGPWKRTKVCDWEACQNKWLECECVSLFAQEGYLMITIKSLDGSVKFSHEFTKMNCWRDGSSFVRPKWGLYRSLEDKSAITNEEDVVSFTKFRIQEWSALPYPIRKKQNDSN